MKQQHYFCFWLGLLFFGMVGCTTESNHSTPTPTQIIENKEIPVPTMEEKEPTIMLEANKEDKLLEALKELGISFNGYNSLNRKLSINTEIGFEGNSDFCMDETTGVIYFVNQGKDNYLYAIKKGEVQLAVAMPVKQVYPYQGVVYFMIDNSDTYDLQEKHSGDIYCYIPESGVVELVYETGAIENSEDHKLMVEESGIYFCYTIIEGSRGISSYYYLPFGETEPIKDKKFTAIKGWKDYFFGLTVLKSRTPKEDGTRDIIELPVQQECFCVVGDILYSAGRTNISCVDLNTGEQTTYDFLEAIQPMVGTSLIEDEKVKLIQDFTITEDAVWITTGASLYRMDLQSGEVSYGMTMEETRILTLYTDGKELYGVQEMSKDLKVVGEKVVHILTDSISHSEGSMIKVEDLIK